MLALISNYFRIGDMFHQKENKTQPKLPCTTVVCATNLNSTIFWLVPIWMRHLPNLEISIQLGKIGSDSESLLENRRLSPFLRDYVLDVEYDTLSCAKSSP